MTQLENKVRFVHNVESPQQHIPRFTIAYHRDAERIIFAWTELYYADEYVRKTGRQVAEGRLMKFAESLLISDCGYDDDEKLGVIDCEFMMGDFDNVLADHMRDGMDLMSFKHAYISKVLFQRVIGVINTRTY